MAYPRSRASNSDLCRTFRKLLTEDFFVIDQHGEINPENMRAETLIATKPWHGDVWKAFKELEERLCPLGVM